jgi:hypothetical protein
MNNREEMSEGMTPKLPLWSYQVQSDSKLAVRTRKDLEIHLITRALKDEGFKQELLANPKEVVEKELGTKLPDDLEINVLEETEDSLYMVLPCNPYEGMLEEELKDSLEMTYEDVAQWVLEQQRNTFMDEESSIILIARAWKNKAFKERLLCQPEKVINEEICKSLPEKIRVVVFNETINIVYIVLPKAVDNFKELSEGSTDKSLLEANMIMIGGSGCGNQTLGYTHNFSCETRQISGCPPTTNRICF